MVESKAKAPLNPDGSDGGADETYGRMMQSRRSNLRRMLVLPLVLMAVLIVLVVVARDMRIRQERLTAMEELGTWISEFREREGKLPTEDELQQFETTTRASTGEVSYNRERILDNSPADTVLAYTSPLDFWFRENGHAVLYLGGEVEWVNPEALAKMLKKREQQYNASRLSM